MNVFTITVSTLAIVMLAACSASPSKTSPTTPLVTVGPESKVFDYKAPPVKVKSLDVPPDLTSYVGDDRYSIPGETETGARHSDYPQGGASRKANSELPTVKNVRLEQNGTQRWLIVHDQAENVWPVVKSFWQENKFIIKIENSQAGVIETEWAETRAKIPMGAFRKFISYIGGIFSSDELDQYHTRLQRSKDGNSTEIYIRHYGLQEATDRNETGWRWMTRASDPELEATMLQLLMSKLDVKVKSLDAPPDLTSNVGDVSGEAEKGTRYSDYSQGGARRKANSVLPLVKNVRLEQNGTQRWLLVSDEAENIFPVVKSFWQDNGFIIKIENAQDGVIETEWAGNRAKIPMDRFRKLMKVVDGMFSSAERDQYHTRLQRSKDDKSTEIYIIHSGLQEVTDKNETGWRWITRANDPELEATMLQLLMSKLGGGSGVLDNKQKTTAVPAIDVLTAPKLNKLADGSQSIVLSESFDKSWRKVGLALEQAKIILADKDRSKGIYYLSAGKDDVKNKQGSEIVLRNEVYVREIGSVCEVVVTNGAGASNAETQKIIDALYKALGQI